MTALSFEVILQSLKQVGGAVALIILITILLEVSIYWLFVKTLKYKYALPVMLLTPAVIGLLLLIVYPICYEFGIAFSNMSLDNFKKSYNITDQALAKLQEDGVAPETLAKLKGLTEQVYPSEEELLSGLTAIIGADQMAAYKDLFLKYAQKTESDQKTTTFKITRRTLFSLRNEKVPDQLLAQLEGYKGIVNTSYQSEKAFLSDLEQVIGKEQTAQYQATFLKDALANPGPKFGIEQGYANFQEIFTQPILKQIHFWSLFWRTVLWTGIQVTTHVTLGLGLAMLLNRPMRMRGFYRSLIVIPWAIPNIIAVMIWRGEFHSQYGFINIMLRLLGFSGPEWRSDPFWNFVAMNITNIWLGVPFMMVILLGGLQSIDQTYYEAAEVDGATGWHKFRHITLPLIQPVMTPAVVLGVIWTFNNFNVPFLINSSRLESSDILVTALFRAAFEYNRYGFAAAFALVIFAILLAFCVAYMRIVKLDLGVSAAKKKKG